MAKYQKAIDIWACADDVMSGKIKLQTGQWLRIGDSPNLSRFHHANKSNICAFHSHMATKDFVNFCRNLNNLKKEKNND